MTSNSSITIANSFPAAMGTVDVAITDNQSATVQLIVPGNGSVLHPVDASLGPWTVQATLNGNGSLAPTVSGALTAFSDASTVITIGLDTKLAPEPAPNAGPAVAPAAPASSSLGGFAATDTSSLFDPSHQTPVEAVELPPSRQLNMAMAPQIQTNWCWAAVGSSVKAFFAGAGPTQCSLATWAFGPSADCCTGNKGSGTVCNQPFYLDRVLTFVGCLAVKRDRKLLLGEVQNEIAAGRPVGVRVQFSGGHFLCIDGYDTSKADATIDLKDPWYGSSIVKFAQFPDNYHGATAWSHSYLTKA